VLGDGVALRSLFASVVQSVKIEGVPIQRARRDSAEGVIARERWSW
jgi:hypothetical protein